MCFNVLGREMSQEKQNRLAKEGQKLNVNHLCSILFWK